MIPNSLHTAAPPFAHSSGPKDAKIALVGEAWGEQEELVGRPFIGSSGQELTLMLREAGIERSSCFLTNVVAVRPPGGNKFENICCNRKEAHDEALALGLSPVMPPLQSGKYLRPRYYGEVHRLWRELQIVRPTVVVALGNPACWATIGNAKIGRVRGYTHEVELGGNYPAGAAGGGTELDYGSDLAPTRVKVVPTYHPAAVLRDWSQRPIVVTDFMKVKREAQFKEIRRPQRFVLVNPTLEEAYSFAAQHVPWAKELSIDLETKGNQISVFGIGFSRTHAMTIPFIDLDQPSGSFWRSHEAEVSAWRLCAELLALPIPKLFQNGMFDLQHLYKMGFRVSSCDEDTLLLHHSLYPEMRKSLEFLGSIYTDEAAWKLMVRHREEAKVDE